MTQESIRQRLLEELNTALGLAQKVDDHLRNRDRTPPADSGERAIFLENDDVLEALDAHQDTHVAALRAALERVDAGTHGTCTQCGSSIQPARLQALPHVALCIRCAH